MSSPINENNDAVTTNSLSQRILINKAVDNLEVESICLFKI